MEGLILSSIDYINSYLPLLVVIAFAMAFTIGMLVANFVAGPHRKRKVKEEPYESGMPVVQDARGRTHIRFYVIAVLFLLFDVEVVLLWPMTQAYYRVAVEHRPILWNGQEYELPFVLGGLGVFLLLLAVGFLYEWRKGVFKWD